MRRPRQAGGWPIVGGATPRRGPIAGLWAVWLAVAACSPDSTVDAPSGAADTAGSEAGADDIGAGDGADDGATGDGAPGDGFVGRIPACESPADCPASPSPCQAYACHEALGCVLVALPEGAQCETGDLCVISGACAAGSCAPHKAKDCDDGDLCTDDGCKGGACSHLPTSLTLVCDDGDACTGGGACVGGVCKAKANVCGCQSDADCKGKSVNAAGVPDLCLGSYYCAVQPNGGKACVQNPATIVVCNPGADTACQKNVCAPATGVCGMVTTAEGGACEDGDPCTAGETCGKGSCSGGTQICCTADVDCQDDGNLCNGKPFCNKAVGKCQLNPATIVICPSVDDTACSQNVCDPKSGSCKDKATANGEVCDDGNPCTPGENCQGGLCTATATNTCPCKKDSDCKEKDDGDPCNGVPFCDLKTGACAVNPATVVICPTVDDTTCSTNVCDPKTGSCAMTKAFDGTPCNADGNPCTPNDDCKAGVCAVDDVNTCVCSSNAECAAHDDGDLCNGALFCDKADATGEGAGKGTCKVNPATIPSCPTVDNTACVKSICQGKTGKCAMTFVNQGEICDDGDPCTKGDTCLNGACTVGGDVCLCKKDTDCLAQEDQDACNGTLYCDKSLLPWSCAVKPSTVIVCPTVNDSYCQQSLCQKATGLCKITPLHNEEPCDDADTCTVNTVCKGGVCSDPLAASGGKCNDGNPCTDDSCDKTVGCVYKTHTGACEDGDKCTEGDTCKDKVCIAGKPATCDDGNACTTNLCNPQSGCVAIQNADACSDGNACTDGDTCKAGACVPGKAKNCADNDPCSLDLCDSKTGACSNNDKVDVSLLCDDGVACTIDTCNGLVGCVHSPAQGSCEDNVACTVDACHVLFGCSHFANHAACADSDSCTLDTCVAAVGCKQSASADATGCNDGDPCSLGDACKAGKCVGGAVVPGCSVDPKQCQGKANGTPCNDGDPCSKGESCLSGVCTRPLVQATLETVVAAPVAGVADGVRRVATAGSISALARLPAGGVAFASVGIPAVRVLSHDGRVSTLAGRHAALSDDVFTPGNGHTATLGEVGGLTAAADGTLHASDTKYNLVFGIAPDRSVSLRAGSGVAGYADGKGAAAQFETPQGLALAADGSLFVCDSGNAVIRRIAKDGTVTTVSGVADIAGGDDGKSSARWYHPEGIALAPDGNFLIVDRVGQTVRRLAPDGTVTTLVGAYLANGAADGKGTEARFHLPASIAVDASGVMWVADYANYGLRRITPDLQTSTVIGKLGAGVVDGPAESAKVSGILRIAIDAGGDLWISDYDSATLRRLRLRVDSCDDGDVCTRDDCDPATGKCVAPGIDCDDGALCTADTCDAGKGTCSHQTAVHGSACDDGDPCTLAGLCGAGHCHAAAAVKTVSGPQGGDDGDLAKAGFYGLTGLRASGDGRVAIVDGGWHRVRVLGQDGKVSTVFGVQNQAGNADGPAGVARLANPRGVEFALDGSLFVADTGNHKVRRVTLDGAASTVAGHGDKGSNDGPVAVARFADPYDVVLGADGAVLVADTGNHRIRRISGGTVSTWAGAGYGFRDGPSSYARFSSPTALARAPTGEIIVADYGNASLRRVDTKGLVVTVAGGGRNEWRMGQGLEAALQGIHGVSVDRIGNIWVASSSGRVAIVDRSGRAHAVAGGAPNFVDGIGAGASLGQLVAVTTLPDGRALVVDASLDRLRTVQPAIAGCDDANACTSDQCAPKVGCLHLQSAAPCDDGDPCSVGDVCTTGACKAGSKVAGCVCKPGPGQGCGDGNPCTIDTCDPKAGCATAKVLLGPCDDGSPCTAASACNGGSCQPLPSAVTVRHGAGVDHPTPDCCVGARDGATAQLQHVAVGRLSQPLDMATAPNGAVYIADSGNQALRVLTSDGRLDTVAGSPGQLAGGQDGPPGTGRFHTPYGVALDLLGGIYVADNGGSTIRRVDKDGAVTTVAGLYLDAGFADGKGAAARFVNPRGLGSDAAGNILIADTGNHRVRSLGLDGQVKTRVGKGPGSTDGPLSVATLNSPEDVAADAFGALYIADAGNLAIRRLDPAGHLTTVVATGSASAPLAGPGARGGRFGYVGAIAVAPMGVIFGDTALGVVRRLRPEGGTELLAGGGDAAWGLGAEVKVQSAYGVAPLPDGSLLIGLLATARLRRLRPIGSSCDDGNACTLDVCGGVKGCQHTPADLAKACPDGGPCQQASCDVAVGTCSYAARENGTPCGAAGDCVSQCRRGLCAAVALVSHTVAGIGDDSFLTPVDVAVHPNGTRYVLDYEAAKIRAVAPNGALSTLAGSTSGYKEGKGVNVQFNTPIALAYDGVSALFVGDSGNFRLRKVDLEGNVSTIAGTGTAGSADGPATLASFGSLTGVAAQVSTVWITDAANATIRRLKEGKLTTVAGKAGIGGLSDGPFGTNILNNPQGIALDGKGVLWIADTGNHAIRRLSQDGMLTTVLGDVSLSATATDGRGWRAATVAAPYRLAALADGSLVWSEVNGSALRRGWPFVRTETIAGADGSSGAVDGLGVYAQLGLASGLSLDANGQLWVIQPKERRLRRLTLGLQACEAAAGASPKSPGLSCAALAKSLPTTGLNQVWLDPTPGAAGKPFATLCDHQTAGGGWTRIDPSIDAVEINALLAGKGQVMYKCNDAATVGVVSPPFAGKWSWQSKIAQPGTWQVAGTNVTCGNDASFAALTCGFGVGCASAGEAGPWLMPGVGGTDQCAGPTTAFAGGAMALCDGAAAHAGWVIYVR